MGFLGVVPDIKYCVPYVHYRYLYQNGKRDSPKACLYILDAGHSRGCAAGEGCSKRETPKEWARSILGAAKLEQRTHNSAGGTNGKNRRKRNEPV